MFGLKMMVVFMATVATLATAGTGVAAQGAEGAKDEGVVLENDRMKVTVSPVGARIVSLVDKVRGREEVKAAIGGANEVRFGAALNISEAKDRYVLTLQKLPDGTQKLTAVTHAVPAEEKPGAAMVTKEYLLAPGSGSLGLSLEIKNTGSSEVGLIPWVRHILLRGTKEQPEETHMTANGGFITGKNLPRARGQKIKEGEHYFPAGNWTSRVVLPVEDGSNTLMTVTRPEDMLKVYCWHRSLEDFATQEVVAAPMFIEPGKTVRWEYFMVLAPVVRNVVYGSPEVVVGVTPHPTWLTAETKELALDFGGAVGMKDVKVHARLVSAEKPETAIKEYDFTLPELTAGASVRQVIPVSLEDKQGYQLRLTFKRDGKDYHPGGKVGETGDVVIPMVVGSPAKAPVVYTPAQRTEGRLRQMTAQVLEGTAVYSGEGLDVARVPSAQRVFKADTVKTTGKGDVKLFACAGEYESAQLVLTAKDGGAGTYEVLGADLTGPGGKVACESVNQFLYVPTRMPSMYNALYPVGEYPEALLPTKSIALEKTGSQLLFVTYRVPMDAKPGVYRGRVTLAKGGVKHEVPVEMTVWNVALPMKSKNVEFASSLKGNTLVEAKKADGSALTPAEQVAAIEDMHLKYRLTPCDSGLAGLLLKGDYAAFEPRMQRFIDGGATKIFLGNAALLLKSSAARLPEVDAYLQKKGWSDYFYARPGFDEASPDLAPKIRAVCEEWKKVSHVPLMETYYNDERAEELFGLLTIWSRNFPEPKWLPERAAAGDRFWKVNAMPGLLEPEPWVSGRRRYVVMWDHHFTGSYVWTVKAWSGVNKWGEDYWCDGGVGNLSAVLMWPHETGILSTIRLEAMRDGLEDATLLWMLRDRVNELKDETGKTPEQAKALKEARALVQGGPLAETIKSAADMDRLRIRAGEAMAGLNTQFPVKGGK